MNNKCIGIFGYMFGHKYLKWAGAKIAKEWMTKYADGDMTNNHKEVRAM